MRPDVFGDRGGRKIPGFHTCMSRIPGPNLVRATPATSSRRPDGEKLRLSECLALDGRGCRSAVLPGIPFASPGTRTSSGPSCPGGAAQKASVRQRRLVAAPPRTRSPFVRPERGDPRSPARKYPDNRRGCAPPRGRLGDARRSGRRETSCRQTRGLHRSRYTPRHARRLH
jgi:hypothetical protein